MDKLDKRMEKFRELNNHPSLQNFVQQYEYSYQRIKNLQQEHKFPSLKWIFKYFPWTKTYEEYNKEASIFCHDKMFGDYRTFPLRLKEWLEDNLTFSNVLTIIGIIVAVVLAIVFSQSTTTYTHGN